MEDRICERRPGSSLQGQRFLVRLLKFSEIELLLAQLLQESRFTMQHNLEQTIALLTQTPAALNALLRGLPAEWTLRNEGGDSWTVFDVIGHLIHGERADWIPRARSILQDGENRAFDPLDKRASEG